MAETGDMASPPPPPSSTVPKRDSFPKSSDAISKEGDDAGQRIFQAFLAFCFPLLYPTVAVADSASILLSPKSNWHFVRSNFARLAVVFAWGGYCTYTGQLGPAPAAQVLFAAFIVAKGDDS